MIQDAAFVLHHPQIGLFFIASHIYKSVKDKGLYIKMEK